MNWDCHLTINPRGQSNLSSQGATAANKVSWMRSEDNHSRQNHLTGLDWEKGYALQMILIKRQGVMQAAFSGADWNNDRREKDEHDDGCRGEIIGNVSAPTNGGYEG